MENKTLIKLIEFVGARLAGKPLTVRMQQPATKGCEGEIHRSLDDRLIIDISPNPKDDERFLYVVLHEIAHAKHHNFVRSNEFQQLPGTIENKQLNRIELRHEDQADAQAIEWIAWGKKHANKTLLRVALFEAVLIALINYPGGKK